VVSNIVIDTTQVATDTIDYVATDQNGLTSTSTRTVIIETPSKGTNWTSHPFPSYAKRTRYASSAARRCVSRSVLSH